MFRNVAIASLALLFSVAVGTANAISIKEKACITHELRKRPVYILAPWEVAWPAAVAAVQATGMIIIASDPQGGVITARSATPFASASEYLYLSVSMVRAPQSLIERMGAAARASEATSRLNEDLRARMERVRHTGAIALTDSARSPNPLRGTGKIRKRFRAYLYDNLVAAGWPEPFVCDGR